MKKWLSLLVFGALIYLTSTRFKLTNILYASSCHFAYDNDNYTVTLLILDNQNANEVVKAKAENIEDVFSKIEDASSLVMNYRHIQSVIFDYSVLNDERLNAITSFLLNNSMIDFNFYVFASDCSVDDLFSYKNPTGTSAYYSILNVDDKNDNSFSYVKPKHFTNFLKRKSDSTLIKIPIIGISKEYENTNLKIDGIVCINKKKYNVFLKDNYPYLYVFNEFKQSYVRLEEYHAIINTNKISYSYNDKLVIRILMEYEGLLNLDNGNEIEAFYLDKVWHLLDEFKKKEIDFFNLEETNILKNKNYSYDDIDIRIEVIKK